MGFKQWTASLALYLTSSSFAAKPVTPKTLEYLDKVQDFDMELITARATLQNSMRDHAQLREECEHVKAMVKKGYEPSTQRDGCEAAILAAETRVTELKNSVATLQRNHEIWALRLEAEETGKPDSHQLADRYVTKWKLASAVVVSQIENAKRKLRQATEYHDWAHRVRMKGLMQEFEYEHALNARTAAAEELNAQLERQMQINRSLKETQENRAQLDSETGG